MKQHLCLTRPAVEASQWSSSPFSPLFVCWVKSPPLRGPSLVVGGRLMAMWRRGSDTFVGHSCKHGCGPRAAVVQGVLNTHMLLNEYLDDSPL